MRLRRLKALFHKSSFEFRDVIMIDFSQNIIVVITATGIILSLLLLILGVKLKCPGLIMTT